MSEVAEYLDRKGWTYRTVNGEAEMNCPFCGDTERKFSISLESGAWLCRHANRCGRKGNLYQLQQALGDKPRDEESRKVYNVPTEKPRPYDAEVTAFFASRGITEETMRAFHIGKINGRIAFPHYRAGKLINTKLRGIKEKTFSQVSGARQALYLAGDGYDKQRPEIFICEGEIDCMSLEQVGIPNVVAVPNGCENLGWIETDYKALEKVDRVYLCLDADKAGDEACRKIAERLGPWRCYRVRPTLNDWNDMLKAGTLTYDSFLELVNSATDMSPPDLVFPEDILDELMAKDPEAWKTQHSKFNLRLGGFRPGEVTLLTGRPGSGKTVFMNDVTLHMMGQYPAMQVFMASLELRRKTLMKWMLSTAGMIRGEESYKELFKTFNRRLTLYSPSDVISVDDLLNAMEYVARRSGIDIAVIDSMMCVVLGRPEDTLDNQRQLMTKLNAFAMQYQCHIVLVAHPRKGATDESKVSMVDVAGSADLANLAWNVIAMHRGVGGGELTKECYLRILKNRELGFTGTIGYEHDEQWKRFREMG